MGTHCGASPHALHRECLRPVWLQEHPRRWLLGARHRAKPGCISSYSGPSASHVEQSPHPCSPRRQEHRGVWKVTVSKQLQKAKGNYGKSYSFRLGRKENIKQAKPLGNCCHSLQIITFFKAEREGKPRDSSSAGASQHTSVWNLPTLHC